MDMFLDGKHKLPGKNMDETTIQQLISLPVVSCLKSQKALSYTIWETFLFKFENICNFQLNQYRSLSQIQG